MNKYKSKKVTIDGITFDSKKEAKRFRELSLRQKAGAIQHLERQVKYVLIPAQRAIGIEKYTKGKKKGQTKPGRLIERECAYIADFRYFEDGKMVVEDTKGVKTKDYIIKRKLLLHEYGIRIKEI